MPRGEPTTFDLTPKAVAFLRGDRVQLIHTAPWSADLRQPSVPVGNFDFWKQPASQQDSNSTA